MRQLIGRRLASILDLDLNDRYAADLEIDDLRAGHKDIGALMAPRRADEDDDRDELNERGARHRGGEQHKPEIARETLLPRRRFLGEVGRALGCGDDANRERQLFGATI